MRREGAATKIHGGISSRTHNIDDAVHNTGRGKCKTSYRFEKSDNQCPGEDPKDGFHWNSDAGEMALTVRVLKVVKVSVKLATETSIMHTKQEVRKSRYF